MPLALVIIGAIFLTAAVRGKQDDLFALLKDDFTGPNNFFYWGLSIWFVSAIGYYKPLKPLSNALLVLVFIVLVLSHRGLIESFMRQIGSTAGTRNSADFIGNVKDALGRLGLEGL